MENKSAKFLGEKRIFTEIEHAAVDYLQERELTDYPQFKDHLLGLGYGKPAADKAITTSPLVTVDKTGQRTTYTYQLIAKAAKVVDDHGSSASRYQTFKNRLKELLTSSTDSTNEAIVRREQSILREWLFNHQDTVHCAVCGGSFSVSALVTAHKKKRSLCTDAERVDPNVVFPLCAFGCDFLYEVDMIRIVDGKVQTANLPTVNTTDRVRAAALSGREIEARWLEGATAYFSRNLT